CAQYAAKCVLDRTMPPRSTNAQRVTQNGIFLDSPTNTVSSVADEISMHWKVHDAGHANRCGSVASVASRGAEELLSCTSLMPTLAFGQKSSFPCVAVLVFVAQAVACGPDESGAPRDDAGGGTAGGGALGGTSGTSGTASVGGTNAGGVSGSA